MAAISDNDLPLSSDPDQYAIPVYLYDATTPLQTVRLSGYFSSYDAGDDSRRGYGFAPTITGIPIPADALQSDGSDGQIVIWNPATGTEYSFWQFARLADGTYIATNGYRYHTAAATRAGSPMASPDAAPGPPTSPASSASGRSTRAASTTPSPSPTTRRRGSSAIRPPSRTAATSAG